MKDCPALLTRLTKACDLAEDELADSPREHLAELTQAYDLGEDELADAAKKAAAHMQRLAALWHAKATPQPVIVKTIRRISKSHRVELPTKPGLEATINRLTHPTWWRRALRIRFRHVERAAIAAGDVHRHASPYLSPRAARRFERDRLRTAELLASLEAVNQSTGEIIALGELAENSLANPANRRRALAARIKGVEQYATTEGLEALFLTITCPSRMHPRHSKSGQANERHDGTSPRQAQAHLCKVWSAATRKLAHLGIKPYGLRVVEPHHDACPHWHVLAFVAPERAEVLIQTVRAYALRESPEEPGAAERRFKVERIDPAKGSALGYVLKYVSKSIDGEGVEDDNESTQTGRDAARRIVGWARLWGMRQFQFFGLPSITPTRELYRCDRENLPSRALREAHDATKANDYAAYLSTLRSFAMSFSVDYSERPSARYPQETARRILGLAAGAVDLTNVAHIVTRTEEWRIQPRGGEAQTAPVAAPWTRFNNSAPLDSIEVFREVGGPPAACRPSEGTARRRHRSPPPQPAPNTAAPRHPVPFESTPCTIH